MMMTMMAIMMMMMALSYEVWVRAETEAGVGKPTKPVTTRLEQRGLHQTQFHIYIKIRVGHLFFLFFMCTYGFRLCAYPNESTLKKCIVYADIQVHYEDWENTCAYVVYSHVKARKNIDIRI